MEGEGRGVGEGKEDRTVQSTVSGKHHSGRNRKGTRELANSIS